MLVESEQSVEYVSTTAIDINIWMAIKKTSNQEKKHRKKCRKNKSENKMFVCKQKKKEFFAHNWNNNTTLYRKVPNMWHIFINLSYLFHAFFLFCFFCLTSVLCQAPPHTSDAMYVLNSNHLPKNMLKPILHQCTFANANKQTNNNNDKNVANFSHSFRV